MLVVFLSGAFLYLLSYRCFWKVDSKEREEGPGYEMVSHRGVTVNAPENTIESFIDAVCNELIHPIDAKFAVADAISELLNPINEYFQENPELLEKVESFV